MSQASRADRAERIEATIRALQDQLVTALALVVGKVTRPRRGSLSQALTVQSPEGSYLHVTVREGRRSLVTQTFSVLVEEARDADYRCKHRAREFKGITDKLSSEELAAIAACVKKHLAFKDAAETERAERDSARKAREKLEKQADARLRAIGKRHGIRGSGRELHDGKLSATRQREGYALQISGLSEPELDGLLSLWREFNARAAAPETS